jgi:hypothetical protein
MDSEEREIFHFLKTRGSDFVNPAEIARRASNKKKFYDDPTWAKPILTRMQERGVLEHNALGQYRIKPVSKKGKGNRWVAPDIAKILEESGVEMDNAGSETAPDEYYEEL